MQGSVHVLEKEQSVSCTILGLTMQVKIMVLHGKRIHGPHRRVQGAGCVSAEQEARFLTTT